MKKLNTLFLVFTLIFASCSSDDGTPEISGDIVGIWEMVDYDYSGTTVTQAQGQTLSANFVGEAYDIDYTLTFEENPNKVISEGSFSLELTTTVAGQTSTQNIEALDVLESGTWEIINGELVTVTSNGEGKMKIEQLTESTLVLSIEEELDLSQSGASIISTVNAIVIMEKL